MWSLVPYPKFFSQHNILKASLLSMKRAIKKLSKKPDLILIDGTFAPEGINNYKTVVNGDEKIKCISAASIIAKTYRDLLMIKLSSKFINILSLISEILFILFPNLRC